MINYIDQGFMIKDNIKESFLYRRSMQYYSLFLKASAALLAAIIIFIAAE